MKKVCAKKPTEMCNSGVVIHSLCKDKLKTLIASPPVALGYCLSWAMIDFAEGKIKGTIDMHYLTPMTCRRRGCGRVLVRHMDFTSLRICQPGRRGRCCGSAASLRCAAASGPSGGWRWRPASPAPLKAPTRTGCRWAHPPCPPNA